MDPLQMVLIGPSNPTRDRFLASLPGPGVEVVDSAGF